MLFWLQSVHENLLDSKHLFYIRLLIVSHMCRRSKKQDSKSDVLNFEHVRSNIARVLSRLQTFMKIRFD